MQILVKRGSMTLQRTLLVSLMTTLCGAPVASFADNDGAEATGKAQPLNDFFQTESVFNQEQGEWQVSLGADFGKDDAAKTTAISTGLEYGITDSLQVALEHTPYVRIKPEDDAGERVNGRGNTSLGLKKNWMHVGGSPVSLALGYERIFAKGDADIMGDDAEDGDEIYLSVARDLSETGNTQALLQVGTERAGDAKANFASLAAFHASGKHVLTGEYNWSEEESWITPGVFWKPVKGLEVGAGVGFGVNDTDGHKVLTRLNYEF